MDRVLGGRILLRIAPLMPETCCLMPRLERAALAPTVVRFVRVLAQGRWGSADREAFAVDE